MIPELAVKRVNARLSFRGRRFRPREIFRAIPTGYSAFRLLLKAPNLCATDGHALSDPRSLILGALSKATSTISLQSPLRHMIE
jgi:hypothetical protein